MRDSRSPKEPTPLLWIDFSRVEGSKTLTLDDFISSTVINPAVAFELTDEDLDRRDRHPLQPLNEVFIKPHISGQDSFILSFGVVKYVDEEPTGQDTWSKLMLVPVLPIPTRLWFNAFESDSEDAFEFGFVEGELLAAHILLHELKLKLVLL